MASLTTLIAEASRRGRASASDGRWTARREGGDVIVRHYNHDMIAVVIEGNYVVPLSRGYGSMTDKCGIGRILRGYGINKSYADVFNTN